MRELTETIFLRRMLENTMDQQDAEMVREMSRQIDEIMLRRIRTESEREQPAS